jgi:hypothetical protein
MDELISRITTNVGIDEAKARGAVGVILSFLKQEGDPDKVAKLLEKLPGAASYADDGEDTGGGLGGLLGGGVMAALGKLQALGLGMGEIQSVTQETVDFARERAGADLVNDIVGSIPGLGQFV